MSLTFPVRSGLRVPRVVVRTGADERDTARPWEVEHLTRPHRHQQQQDVAALPYGRRLSVIVEGFLLMRSSVRTVIVVAVAAALVVVFLRNVDLRGVVGAIVQARVRWLVISFVAAVLTIVIRALRWQYLLEPLGHASFANAFRATAVGFAASSILPARAGEVIRPYFLARHENMTATGAFATIVLERVLDVLTVVVLMASSVFVFNRGIAVANPAVFSAMKWAGATALAGAIAALVTMFVLAGDPGRIGRWMARLEATVSSKLAGLIGGVAEKFSRGLG